MQSEEKITTKLSDSNQRQTDWKKQIKQTKYLQDNSKIRWNTRTTKETKKNKTVNWTKRLRITTKNWRKNYKRSSIYDMQRKHLTRRTKIHKEWTTNELNSTKGANMKKLNRGEHTEAKKETRNIHDAYIPAP